MNNIAAQDNYIPDVREILLMLWRHRLRIILVGGASLLVCILFIMFLPKTYSASATIMLEENNVNLENFKDVTEGAKFDNLTVQTEIKMLESLTLAKRTINAADIKTSKEYESLTDAQILSKFMSHLSVAPQGTSRAIEVSFSADDRDLAAKVTNAHVQSYLDMQIEFKKRRVEQLSGLFEEKVKELKEDVVSKSKAVEEFRSRESLAMGKDSEELIYQQISDISAQLAPIQVRKYDIQAKLLAIETAEQGNDLNAIVDVVDSRLVQDLKAQASLAGQRFESVKPQYGPNHPKYSGARNELSQVNGAIAREVKNIVNALKNEEQSITAQEEMLQQQLADLNLQAEDMRDKLISLKALQVEQEASQKILDNFLANYQNVQSQTSFARPDAVVISQAVPPAFSKGPGKKLLLLLSALFSVCLALGFVFISELMRNGIRNFGDIRKMGQQPLGIIPNTPNPVATILSKKDSSLKECVKRIYMSGIMNSSARSILVTSAMPNEGRTTFLTALAHYMMSIGHKVIVVDADFLRPDISSTTRVPQGPGLFDVLAGKVTLQQAIDTDKNNLPILRAGNKNLFSPDIVKSQAFKDLLSELKDSYGYVLVDSGPMLARAEAGTIAHAVDGIIIITEWMKTTRQALQSMFGGLESTRTPVLGLVINRVDIGKYKADDSSGSDFLLPRAAA